MSAHISEKQINYHKLLARKILPLGSLEEIEAFLSLDLDFDWLEIYAPPHLSSKQQTCLLRDLLLNTIEKNSVDREKTNKILIMMLPVLIKKLGWENLLKQEIQIVSDQQPKSFLNYFLTTLRYKENYNEMLSYFPIDAHQFILQEARSQSLSYSFAYKDEKRTMIFDQWIKDNWPNENINFSGQVAQIKWLTFDKAKDLLEYLDQHNINPDKETKKMFIYRVMKDISMNAAEDIILCFPLLFQDRNSSREKENDKKIESFVQKLMLFQSLWVNEKWSEVFSKQEQEKIEESLSSTYSLLNFFDKKVMLSNGVTAFRSPSTAPALFSKYTDFIAIFNHKEFSVLNKFISKTSEKKYSDAEKRQEMLTNVYQILLMFCLSFRDLDGFTQRNTNNLNQAGLLKKIITEVSRLQQDFKVQNKEINSQIKCCVSMLAGFLNPGGISNEWDSVLKNLKASNGIYEEFENESANLNNTIVEKLKNRHWPNHFFQALPIAHLYNLSSQNETVARSTLKYMLQNKPWPSLSERREKMEIAHNGSMSLLFKWHQKINGNKEIQKLIVGTFWHFVLNAPSANASYWLKKTIKYPEFLSHIENWDKEMENRILELSKSNKNQDVKAILQKMCIVNAVKEQLIDAEIEEKKRPTARRKI